MSGFWAMGGYAMYIWPAYGLSFAALGLASFLSWRGYARAKARLSALERKAP
jgi:heme exporter protein D